jgi:hypothetical protein
VQDHAHGCSGDVYALVAALAGLDVGPDFPRVIELTAAIAGVSAAPSNDADHRRREFDQEHAERQSRRDLAEQAATMAAMWNGLDRRSVGGERYLEIERGTDPTPLRHRNVVRFGRRGEPAAALRDLVTGDVVGVQFRAIGGSEPKVRSASGSRVSGAALVGRVAELDPLGCDVAVVCEGLMDSLTAVVAFPGCAVYGAGGAQQLSGIAAVVAPRIKAIRGLMLLIPQADRPGIEGSAAAVRAAQAAGLELDRDLVLVELVVDRIEHHDLNDAYRAGWRWRWPDDLSRPGEPA